MIDIYLPNSISPTNGRAYRARRQRAAASAGSRQCRHARQGAQFIDLMD